MFGSNKTSKCTICGIRAICEQKIVKGLFSLSVSLRGNYRSLKSGFHDAGYTIAAKGGISGAIRYLLSLWLPQGVTGDWRRVSGTRVTWFSLSDTERELQRLRGRLAELELHGSYKSRQLRKFWSDFSAVFLHWKTAREVKRILLINVDFATVSEEWKFLGETVEK
jgi:hypothetical protein